MQFHRYLLRKGLQNIWGVIAFTSIRVSGRYIQPGASRLRSAEHGRPGGAQQFLA